MRLLVFAPFACSGGHHETDLEVTMDHLNRGDEVHVIYCKRELSTCLPNPQHRLYQCLSCYPLVQRSFDAIGLPRKNLHKLEFVEEGVVDLPTEFKNVQELLEYEWNGIEVGRVVATSLITLTYDTQPDMKQHGAFVLNEIRGFIQTYKAVLRHIESLRPDLFYVFNGRSTNLNASFVAAKRSGVDTVVGERDVFQKYILIPNDNGVSLDFAQSDIRRVASRLNQDPEAVRLAHEWFTANRNGNREQLCNYLRDQKTGTLPAGWNPSKKNIGIFTSSEFELVGIRGWENPLFADQLDAISYILDSVKSPDIHFYIRCHPNLSGRNTNQMRNLSQLSKSNLTILDPESPIDTYALMEAVDTVLSFGSTIGIEATYWGKPSVLVGHSFWEKLGAAYCPKTRDELIKILQANLKPLPQESVLPYGYWWKSRGIPFRHITPANPLTGAGTKIKSHVLKPPEWALAFIRWKFRFDRLINLLG